MEIDAKTTRAVSAAAVDADALRDLATRLFRAAGLDADKAGTIARLLVLTDMMGRHSHGLAQAGHYLSELADGGMTREGGPEVIVDRAATIVWDGRYLPGLWLMDRALELAATRVRDHGLCSIAIRRSHHIGCLAAIAKGATDRGLIAMIASSGPHTRSVAPHGGKVGLMSPNPFAFAFPAAEAPVLVDICASLTTMSMTREKARAGELFDHPWLLDADGRPTADPDVLEGNGARGSLMLLGGTEAGHKGFGLALMVEALTQGLSGHGRHDAPTRWGASVYLQLFDPRSFAGSETFATQIDFLAGACRANPPIDPNRPVRLPGEQAIRNIARHDREGIALPCSTIANLRTWSKRLNISAEYLERLSLNLTR